MKDIYALYDVGGKIRYIGQAINAQDRLAGHWSERYSPSNSRKTEWLRTLSDPPDMKVLMKVRDMEADATEHNAIMLARTMYGREQILNGNDGVANSNWRRHRDERKMPGVARSVIYGTVVLAGMVFLTWLYLSDQLHNVRYIYAGAGIWAVVLVSYFLSCHVEPRGRLSIDAYKMIVGPEEEAVS